MKRHIMTVFMSILTWFFSITPQDHAFLEIDVPKKYTCILVKPKNRVQEARRNVEEDSRTNICSFYY